MKEFHRYIISIFILSVSLLPFICIKLEMIMRYRISGIFFRYKTKRDREKRYFFKNLSLLQKLFYCYRVDSVPSKEKKTIYIIHFCRILNVFVFIFVLFAIFDCFLNYFNGSDLIEIIIDAIGILYIIIDTAEVIRYKSTRKKNKTGDGSKPRKK